MIDLRELMDDRSTPPTDLAQHLRLADLRHRITVRRNRRIGGAIAAVVALGAIGYGLLPARHDAAPAQPAGPNAGFPAYLGGARVIAATRSRPGLNSLTLTFDPPGTSTFELFTDCTGAPGVDLQGELVVDGVVRQTGACGDLTMTWQSDEDRGREFSVKLRVVAADRATGKDVAFPEGATIAIAAAVPVPWDAYPLPDRPAVLAEPAGPQQLLDAWQPPLLPSTPSTDTKVLDARLWLRGDSSNRLQPHTTTVRSGDRYTIISQSLTPGSLLLRLDGVDIHTETWWDYDADLHTYAIDLTGPEYHSGQGRDMTVTVVPDHVTGDWQLLLQADTPLPPPPRH